MTDLIKAAQILYNAEKNRKQIQALTSIYPDMTLADAKKIQDLNTEKRIEDGEKVIGYKIGLTSKAMQRLLGVDEPDFGVLTDVMLIRDGDIVPSDMYLQPKVEAEVTFCLREELKGPGVTVADVYRATDYLVPSLELVDSRIIDWKVKLEDTVADNGSSAGIILGSGITCIEDVDMRLTGMLFEKNGEIASSGVLADVFGNPAAAVAWLANELAKDDKALEAGMLVMSGAVTAALPAEKGDHFCASFYGMGSVSLKFV